MRHHHNAQPNVAYQWNELTLDAIAETKTTPPQAARALAMVHTAMFNAWANYDECALSTTTFHRLRRKSPAEHTQENWQKAYSYAAFQVLQELFCLPLPEGKKDMFRDLMSSLSYDPDDTSMDISTPQGIGNLSGQMVIDYFFGDGSNDKGTLHQPPDSDFTGYKPYNDPVNIPTPNPAPSRPLVPPRDVNRWQPLTVGGKTQTFLLAQWGLVNAFALQYPWQFRPSAPSRSPSAKFNKEMDDLIRISGSLTEEQKVICEYWLGGPGTITPPGIWCEVAQFVSHRDQHEDWQDVMMFFAVANALHDSAIACWDCKVAYDLARPITAIRNLKAGTEICAWGGPGNEPRLMDGSEWLPYQPAGTVTPPFAEYVSGHSTFSAAAAYILRCFTGSDRFDGSMKIHKGKSVVEPGYTPQNDIILCWDTFTQAAEEAGMSRRYGGIHFEEGDLEGRSLGKKVAECVWDRVQNYFNGKSPK